MSSSSDESALADAIIARNPNRRAIDEAMGRVVAPLPRRSGSRKRSTRYSPSPRRAKLGLSDTSRRRHSERVESPPRRKSHRSEADVAPEHGAERA